MNYEYSNSLTKINIQPSSINFNGKISLSRGLMETNYGFNK